MRLNELLQRSDLPGIEINGMSCDSRTVARGDLFVAVQGGLNDGHTYVDEAVQRGASVVLTERPIGVVNDCFVVADSELVSQRNAIAARLFGNPSQSIECVAVTGTNGKTSVAHGLANMLRDTGFMGSLGWGMCPNLETSDLTTMDGIALQKRLAKLHEWGACRVAMEASSHALVQGRLSDVDLAIGIFTNLSRDHLDYHDSMANYANAKRLLFKEFELSRAVLNIDDEFGRQLFTLCKQRGIDVTTYGRSEEADISAVIDSLTLDGAIGTWRTKWGDAPLRLPIRSEFGVENCAAILGTMLHCGVEFAHACEQLKDLPPVPGRLEFIKHHGNIQVVIDYAHTPDALEKTLRALRQLKPLELICVFGCGGDRDPGKRPLMGAIAEANADRVVVTNDNPRNENPEKIVAETLHGMDQPEKATKILDRESAIEEAIGSASEGSLVLVAGKGAETYQEANGVKTPFSDREAALRFM
ncbi:MAG: UDP-N-acetylmuramoyl-L-alanyl-D-glutamate--2,6-diaminopimelate ligase [Gammaproteobacteria bacterium]|nr:UDP-N-acetylmuramoyl-L-alanyl-D-glutamate--2,6-diaminopimelate ligase [Gammaproteobacteria bacterium]